MAVIRDEAWQALVVRIEGWREALALPGVGLALVTREGDVRMYTAGSRCLATGAPFGPDTLFPLGSLTKGLTAVLAALLVRDGRLDWGSPVVRSLPELPALAEELTLRDLLSHQSGLGYMDLLWSGNRATLAEILVRVAAAEVYDPARPFLYSNVNYLLAGEILARAAGRPWKEILCERLLEPLGMAATSADSAAYLAATDRATGYREAPGGEEGWDPAPFAAFDACAAAGGLQAPLRDVARWLRFLLGEGRELGLWAPHFALSPGASYGLSFRIGAHRGLDAVYQEGNLPGFSASLGLLPELGIALALLVNVSESPLQQRIYREVWDRLLPGPPLPSARASLSGAAPHEDRALVPLHFATADRSFFCTLYERGNGLALDVPGQRPVRLEGPIAPGIYASESDLTLRPALLRRPGEAEPFGMNLFHALQFRGLRVPESERATGAADAGPVLEIDRLPGRYNLEPFGQEVLVHRADGGLAVEIPGDATYPLTGLPGEGRWLVEPTGLQSLEFHGGGQGPARALTWSTLKPVPLERLDREPPPLSAEELLALRRRADGRLHSAVGPPCVAFAAAVRYPHQGLAGSQHWWTAGLSGYRLEEDLGPFGSILYLRREDRIWLKDTLNGQPLRELAGREREAALDGLLADAAFSGAEAAAEALRNLRVLAVEECAGRECYRVWVEARHGDPATCWICRETGRLLRETRGVATTLFEDFRDVAGVSIPFRRVTDFASPAPGRRVVEVLSVTPLAEVPGGLFADPYS